MSGKGTLKTLQYSKYRPLQAGWWCIVLEKVKSTGQKSLGKKVQRVDGSEQDDPAEEELVCSGSHMCYIIRRKKKKRFLNKEWGKSILRRVPKKGELRSCTSHHRRLISEIKSFSKDSRYRGVCLRNRPLLSVWNWQDLTAVSCLVCLSKALCGSQNTALESLEVGKVGSPKHPRCGEISGLDKLHRLSNRFKVITGSR